MTLSRFVFHVSGIDRDAAGLFFRSRVDLIIGLSFAAEVLGKHRADSSRERRLTVVNVTDRADVDVRLGALKLLFCHGLTPEQKPEILPVVFKNCQTKKLLVPVMRIERMTSPLPRECSTTEPHGHT